MPNIFKELRVLRDEGKVHKKLINRLRMLFIISAIMTLVVVYDILFRGAEPLLAATLAVVGFILGTYVFARMSVVQWNEEDQILEAGKMDMLGYATLALYVVFEIGFRSFLGGYFPASGIVLILSVVGGTILGRAVGMVVEIHRVYQSIHA